MANYFKIQPIIISITPFETQEINAIQWTVTSIQRGDNSALTLCNLLYVDENENIISIYYNWSITIPNTVISQWLDDSVIDDYICSTDSRFIKVI